MAYDPKDPNDVKIVADAVTAALEEAAETHASEIEGLKNKNKDLLTKLSKARQNTGEGSAEEVARLESELETTQTTLRETESKLRTATKDLKTVTTERDTLNTSLEGERTTANNLVIENDLTSALTSVNVAGHLFDGAKALLGSGVTVKEVDGKRKAFAGDKLLSEHVKEWALGDQGKHYVAAAGNSGGNDGQHKPGGTASGKKISEMVGQERIAHFNAVGEAKFNEQLAAEKSATK